MSEERKHPHRLDPRKPFVLDTRELGRRPGSMQELRVSYPAPEALGLEMIGVPFGADVELDLRLESVMEGVLVSGTASAPLVGECGRCLGAIADVMSVPLQELFAYEARGTGEDDTALMEGDFLDLQTSLRDAVLLTLPLTPLCTPDCRGLCVECGERLDDLPSDHSHGSADPRWSALQKMLVTDPHADKPQEI